MMVGWVVYVWERPGTAEELAKKPLSMADQFFDRLDRNGDGVITRDEIPEQMLPLLQLSGVKVPDTSASGTLRKVDLPVTMTPPSWVSTDSAWNCTEAKCGPRRACTSPVSGSRLTSMPPTPAHSTLSSQACAAKVL